MPDWSLLPRSAQALVGEVAGKPEAYKTTLVSFLKLFLGPSLGLIPALYFVLLHVQKMEMIDDMARVFLLLSQQHGRELPLLTKLIELEVSTEMDSSTLFRGNNIVTKLMSEFCRCEGRGYLRATLEDVAAFALSYDQPFEVQQVKLQWPSGATPEYRDSVVSQNARNLVDVASRFLQAFYDSTARCPASIRLLCRRLGAIVEARFPANRLSSIGGLIFLRFFSPAVASPEAYLQLPAPSPQARRLLLLVSKILQNLSNGILTFSKDQPVELIDEFLSLSYQRLMAAFEQLVDVPDEPSLPPLLDDDHKAPSRFDQQEASDSEHAAALFVTNFCRINIHKLAKAVLTDPARLTVRSTQLSQRGYLKKLGGKVKNWRMRWFILKGHLLYYFSTQVSADPLGVIALEAVEVHLSRPADDDKTTFMLTTAHRQYHLKAKSELEKHTWTDAITAAKSNYQNLLTNIEHELSSSPPYSPRELSSPDRLTISPCALSDSSRSPPPPANQHSLSPELRPLSSSESSPSRQYSVPASAWMKPTLPSQRNNSGSSISSLSPSPSPAADASSLDDLPTLPLSPSSQSTGSRFPLSPRMSAGWLAAPAPPIPTSSSSSSSSPMTSPILISSPKDDVSVPVLDLSAVLLSDPATPPAPLPPPESPKVSILTASLHSSPSSSSSLSLSSPSLSASSSSPTSSGWTRSTNRPLIAPTSAEKSQVVLGQSDWVMLFNSQRGRFFNHWMEVSNNQLNVFIERPSGANPAMLLETLLLEEARVVLDSTPTDLRLLIPSKEDVLMRFQSLQQAQSWAKSIKLAKLQYWKGLRKSGVLAVFSLATLKFPAPAAKYTCSLTKQHFLVHSAVGESAPPLIEIEVGSFNAALLTPETLPPAALAAFSEVKRPRMMIGSRATDPVRSTPSATSLQNFRSFFSISFVLYNETLVLGCEAADGASQWCDHIDSLEQSRARRQGRKSLPKSNSTAASLRAASPIAGWLDKEEAAASPKPYFCLIDPSKPALNCYITEDTLRTAFSIILTDRIPTLSSDSPHRFVLTSISKPPPSCEQDPLPPVIHAFLAASPDVVGNWIRAINDAKVSYARNVASPEDILSMETPAVPGTPRLSKIPLQRLASRKLLARVTTMNPGETIDLKGYLNKRGLTNRAWKKRWFVLCNAFLLYFETERSSIPLGDIAIQTAVFREDLKPCEFIIQTPEREFYLQASTTLGMHEWLVALKKAKADSWKKHQIHSPAEEFASSSPPNATTSQLAKALRAKGGASKRGSRIGSYTNPGTSYEGWLHKRGGRTTGWKLRWCVIQGCEIHYFKGPQNRDACGIIPLVDSSCSPITIDQDEQANFTLTTRHRIYFLRADTQGDAVQWTSILGRIQTSLATSTLPSLPALTSPLQGSSPASLNQKQGFLYKQGGTVRNWKRRFFTLRRSILRYYENPTDLEPLGEIPLQNGSIDVADESLKRPFSWQISSRFRNYYLAADDDYEMASWMEALRSAMDNTPDDPKDQKRLQLYNLLSRILQQLESLSDPTTT